jgi:hypothetical protein
MVLEKMIFLVLLVAISSKGVDEKNNNILQGISLLKGLDKPLILIWKKESD